MEPAQDERDDDQPRFQGILLDLSPQWSPLGMSGTTLLIIER
jgi:hypothetical protein